MKRALQRGSQRLLPIRRSDVLERRGVPAGSPLWPGDRIDHEHIDAAPMLRDGGDRGVDARRIFKVEAYDERFPTSFEDLLGGLLGERLVCVVGDRDAGPLPAECSGGRLPDA